VIDAPTLWSLVERRAQATPHALFAVDDADRALSFAEYRDAALRCAAGLFERSVEDGVPVAWQLPTTLESMVLCAALARLGAVQVPVLPIYRKRELGFAVTQTGAALLFVPGVLRGFDHAALGVELVGEGQVVVVDGALPEGDTETLPATPPAEVAAQTVRWIFYTSGTTADPKGARHSDAGLLAASRGFSDALALQADDRVALVFPFTHVGGVLWLMNGLRAGCAHIVIPSFDPDTSIDVLARHGVTQAGAGTVFHQAYLAAQRARGDGPIFPAVRAFPGGGAPKPPQLHRDLRAEIGGAGIVAGYGMTECPVLAMCSPDDPDDKLAHTEGRACPRGEMQIRVVRMDGTPVAPGEEGEFRVKGPQLCHGYLDAALDEDAFDEEGFFRSGDLGHLDGDGYVVVTGRLKDVIIRKGENISAREIEDLLAEHPKVAEVAVIGLPDPETGERACAVVAAADAADPLGFAEMQDYLRGRELMAQKSSERLESLDPLPRNPTGKVLKHELRRRFAEES
jgi:acyl-CoA synthetase (AMP-forming)/AMP-acid ligase II